MARWLGMLAAVALTLALAACGGASPDLSSVAQAAQKTEGAGTARFELTFDLGQRPLTARGAFDYDQRRTSMSIDLESFSELFGTMAGGPKDLGLDAILDEQVLYVRFPGLAGFVRPGRPWVKIDLEKLAERSGASLSQLDQLSYADPTQALAYLQGAGEFKDVGTEDVRGVRTTRYEGTIDPQEAADKLPADQRGQLQDLLENSGVGKLPAQAWIDGDGYLRKLALTVPSAGYAPLASGKLTMTLELFDFGKDVAIDVPADDEVTDLSKLTAKEIAQQG